MSASVNNPMDRLAVIITGVVISALGAMFYNLLPLFLGTAQDFRGLSDQAVGALGSSFYVGFTLTTSTAFFWIRKWNWKTVSLVSVPLAAGAMVLAGYAESYALLVTGIFVSGCAFSALYGIGTTVLSDTSHPARWYGLKIASEAGMGAIMLLILPGTIIARWGFEGMMVAMTAALLLLAPLLFWLPKSGNKGGTEQGGPAPGGIPPSLKLALWLGLGGVMMFLFSTTMIWAFVERMANDAGFEPVATGNVLSLTLVCAVGGSLLAMLMGDRFGAGRPFALACLALLVALFLLGRVDTLTDYAIASCLFTFTFGLGIPYVVTVVAELDADGRFVVLSVPAIGLGVMLAPAIGGVLTAAYGYEAILWTGGAVTVLAMSASLFALQSGLPVIRRAQKEGNRASSEPDPLL